MTHLHKKETHAKEVCSTSNQRTTHKNTNAVKDCCSADSDAEDHSGQDNYHNHDHGDTNESVFGMFLPAIIS